MTKSVFPMPGKKAKPAHVASAGATAATAGALSPAALRAAADACEATVSQWRAAAQQLERLEGILAEHATWFAGAPPPMTRERAAAIKLRTEALAAALATANALTKLLRYSAE